MTAPQAWVDAHAYAVQVQDADDCLALEFAEAYALHSRRFADIDDAWQAFLDGFI